VLFKLLPQWWRSLFFNYYSQEAGMKTKILITLALFFLVGCAKQEPARMTPQEQETAKKEIREVLNLLVQAANKMDLEALMQPYLNSPDFILVNTDGSMVDYQGAKNGTADLFKSLASLKFTGVKDEFRFLSNNVVICAWLSKCEMTLKTGELSKFDRYGVTFVFSKINNQWKIIYSHESALPPVQEKPTK
jgi:ketosteroid isomerase-like protein